MGDKSTFLGKGTTILGMKSTVLEGYINKTHFLVTGSSVGVLSVVSRLSVGGIRQSIREGKEKAILIKSTFCVWEFLGRSLVRPWFVLGSS